MQGYVCACVSAISVCYNTIFITGSKNNTSKKNYIIQKLHQVKKEHSTTPAQPLTLAYN